MTIGGNLTFTPDLEQSEEIFPCKSRTQYIVTESEWYYENDFATTIIILVTSDLDKATLVANKKLKKRLDHWGKEILTERKILTVQTEQQIYQEV